MYTPHTQHCPVLTLLILVAGLTLAACHAPDREGPLTDYPIRPVSFADVHIQDAFWAPRIQVDIDTTLPFAFKNLEETGRVKNFEIAAGLKPGAFCTEYPFDDSDVFKVIEGAAYALQVAPDPALDAYLDSLIATIAAAQEPDGYLYTNRTIDPDSTHEWAGSERWQFVHELSHELYNVGHLYEAAVAHYQATGKRSLLDVALKNADLVDRDFGPGKIEKVPGHQVIEMGLAKLYRVTGDERYLALAKFFLDARGPGGDPYSQAHEQVVRQSEAVGHAVRAGYMYAGMADVAALTGDTAYVHAIDRIWEDVVGTKLYVTGGIGNRRDNEGFGEPYDLPNAAAYSETCASIANVFWNHRLFLMRGDARYIDVLERTLYNALLAGVSLSGDRFFYPNPLEADGTYERQPWFGCACCPSNISRFLPSVPGYIYAHNENGIYVNLFVASETRIATPDGPVTIRQAGTYPWDGAVTITVTPQQASDFILFVRQPGWARNEAVPSDLYRFADTVDAPVTMAVNGEPVTPEVEKGYARLQRVWRPGDVVTLTLPMPVRRVLAHDKVAADRGHFALQKGPLVYTVEGIDQADGDAPPLYVPDTTTFATHHAADLLNGVDVITFAASGREGSAAATEPTRRVTAIPYHVWANRGPSPMRVWLAHN